MLGSGEQAIADSLGHAAALYADRFRFVHGYDNELAHLLFGAGDLYLMPSRFEPCGLTQMQAMRYGALPVVTDVGGLHDTVRDADRHPDGNGFVAPHADSAALTAALFRAVRRVANPRQRAAIASRGMKQDWSWAGPAQEYLDLYARTAGPDVSARLRLARSGYVRRRWLIPRFSSSCSPAVRASVCFPSPTIGPNRRCPSAARTA